MEVKPKKYLGQHFLNDLEIAEKIASTLQNKSINVLEVGPGTGVLTQFLNKKPNTKLYVAEVDVESIEYLISKKIIAPEFIFGDFLKLSLNEIFKEEEVSIIGNFPYNISSQILFKTLENKKKIPEFAGMFQKEVAERICAKPGNKQYGILSVLTQAYYDTQYLFTVNENAFTPPPKVKSGVIYLQRKENTILPCDEKIFKEIIKLTFNTRRKMLRVSLKTILGKHEILHNPFFEKRPEELSVDEFVYITQEITKIRTTDLS